LFDIRPTRRGLTVKTGLWAVFQAAPSCYVDQQLDPTDIKVSIDTFAQYNGLFTLGFNRNYHAL
jgi:hypothetical protein